MLGVKGCNRSECGHGLLFSSIDPLATSKDEHLFVSRQPAESLRQSWGPNGAERLLTVGGISCAHPE
ncbi:hypothetical protein M514_08952 [Trichuris suis]|uniref:Uncharacterized protein n=1 Tax=Trichuris suis TaxID=68888 RepID=A0A085LZ11_9BILA|nr:hypothetical protein M513_08952 [Trichuris suis]KFD70394.1 hypothetical protein M514_08952 [Trichuris suis]